jgi:hypothetical protein
LTNSISWSQKRSYQPITERAQHAREARIKQWPRKSTLACLFFFKKVQQGHEPQPKLKKGKVPSYCFFNKRHFILYFIKRRILQHGNEAEEVVFTFLLYSSNSEVVLKFSINQNLIVINHKSNSNFKNHIIIRIQERLLKLLGKAW